MRFSADSTPSAVKVLPLEEIDCHLHAGLERRETFEEVFDWLAREGRRVVGLLDHAEVYLEDPPYWAEGSLIEARERLAEAGIEDLHRGRLAGPGAFYDEAREAADRFGGDMHAAVGIEISGPYLTRIPPDWLDGADFLGICTSQPPGGAGDVKWGEHMAELLHKADGLRGGRDIPVILHHPFRWRLLELARDPLAGIPDAGGFTEEDAEVVARALADIGAVAEVNFASFWHLSTDAQAIRAARAAFVLLRDAGARFSVGSDLHGVKGLPCRYEPAKALAAFGLTAEDVELPAPFADA